MPRLGAKCRQRLMPYTVGVINELTYIEVMNFISHILMQHRKYKYEERDVECLP